MIVEMKFVRIEHGEGGSSNIMWNQSSALLVLLLFCVSTWCVRIPFLFQE
jgi:hypothetical protein